MDFPDPADADPIDVGLAAVLLRHASSLADLPEDDIADRALWEEASVGVQQYMLSMARAARVYWGHQIHIPGEDFFTGVTELDANDEVQLGELADRIGWTPQVPMQMGERDEFHGTPGPVMLRPVDGPGVWIAWTGEHHRHFDDEVNKSMGAWREALSRAELLGVRVRASTMEHNREMMISHPWLQDSIGDPLWLQWRSASHRDAADQLDATMHVRIAHRLLYDVRRCLESGNDAYGLPFRVIYDLQDIPISPDRPLQEPDVMDTPLPQPDLPENPSEPVPPPSVVRAKPGTKHGNFIVNGQVVQLPEDTEDLNELFRQHVLSANAVAATIALIETEKERAEAPRADPVMVRAVAGRLADASAWPSWLATAVWGHDVREVIQLVLDAAVQAADAGDDERTDLR